MRSLSSGFLSRRGLCPGGVSVRGGGFYVQGSLCQGDTPPPYGYVWAVRILLSNRFILCVHIVFDKVAGNQILI